eukprot:scaffold3648_cov149-Amphora_coffeaeformis.AAC.5
MSIHIDEPSTSNQNGFDDGSFGCDRLDQLNKLLSETRARIQTYEQLKQELEEAEDELQRKRCEIGLFEKTIVQQRKEISRLENMGGTGHKDERLQTFEKSKATNQDKLQGLKKRHSHMAKKADELKHNAALLKSAEREYEAHYAEKRAMLLNITTATDAKTTLEALCQRHLDLEEEVELLDKVVSSGKPALAKLRAASSNLDSAANWGAFDMMGGGMMATMAKRAAIDRAKTSARGAKAHMEQFKSHVMKLSTSDSCREHDILQSDLSNMGGFSAFCDYFMDSFVIDWVVQSQISQARASCNTAIAKVSGIVKTTETRLVAARGEAAQCKQEETAIVLSFGQQ